MLAASSIVPASVPRPEAPSESSNGRIAAAPAAGVDYIIDRFRRLTAWLVLIATVVAIVLALAQEVPVDPSGTGSIDLLLAALLLVSRIWWSQKAHPRIADAFGALALILIGGMGCGAIAMLSLTLHLPLADHLLWSVDNALGLSGTGMVAILLRQGQWLFTILAFVYNATIPAVMLSVVMAALRGERIEAWRGAFCFVGTLLTTCLMAIFVPAKGLGVWASAAVLAHLPVRSMRNFWPLFDQFYFGAHPVLRLDAVDGVISFPSFHTIAGLLLLMMWRKKLATAVPAAVWLVLLLLATFPYGGHYFVDLLGGLAVWGAWYSASRLLERTKPPHCAHGD